MWRRAAIAAAASVGAFRPLQPPTYSASTAESSPPPSSSSAHAMTLYPPDSHSVKVRKLVVQLPPDMQVKAKRRSGDVLRVALRKRGTSTTIPASSANPANKPRDNTRRTARRTRTKQTPGKRTGNTRAAARNARQRRHLHLHHHYHYYDGSKSRAANSCTGNPTGRGTETFKVGSTHQVANTEQIPQARLSIPQHSGGPATSTPAAPRTSAGIVKSSSVEWTADASETPQLLALGRGAASPAPSSAPASSAQLHGRGLASISSPEGTSGASETRPRPAAAAGSSVPPSAPVPVTSHSSTPPASLSCTTSASGGAACLPRRLETSPDCGRSHGDGRGVKQVELVNEVPVEILSPATPVSAAVSSSVPHLAAAEVQARIVPQIVSVADSEVSTKLGYVEAPPTGADAAPDIAPTNALQLTRRDAATPLPAGSAAANQQKSTTCCNGSCSPKQRCVCPCREQPRLVEVAVMAAGAAPSLVVASRTPEVVDVGAACRHVEQHRRWTEAKSSSAVAPQQLLHDALNSPRKTTPRNVSANSIGFRDFAVACALLILVGSVTLALCLAKTRKADKEARERYKEEKTLERLEKYVEQTAMQAVARQNDMLQKQREEALSRSTLHAAVVDAPTHAPPPREGATSRVDWGGGAATPTTGNPFRIHRADTDALLTRYGTTTPPVAMANEAEVHWDEDEQLYSSLRRGPQDDEEQALTADGAAGKKQSKGDEALVEEDDVSDVSEEEPNRKADNRENKTEEDDEDEAQEETHEEAQEESADEKEEAQEAAHEQAQEEDEDEKEEEIEEHARNITEVETEDWEAEVPADASSSIGVRRLPTGPSYPPPRRLPSGVAVSRNEGLTAPLLLDMRKIVRNRS